jgi:hypothetical protein
MIYSIAKSQLRPTYDFQCVVIILRHRSTYGFQRVEIVQADQPGIGILRPAIDGVPQLSHLAGQSLHYIISVMTQD